MQVVMPKKKNHKSGFPKKFFCLVVVSGQEQNGGTIRI